MADVMTSRLVDTKKLCRLLYLIQSKLSLTHLAVATLLSWGKPLLSKQALVLVVEAPNPTKVTITC